MKNEATLSQAKRIPKGIFPRATLNEANALVLAIFGLGDGEPVRRIQVFDMLGKSPDSVGSRNLITAANSGYGLSTGGYQAEFLALTDLGRRMTVAPDEKSRAITSFDALFKNETFTDFVRYFNQKSIRTDEVAIDYIRKRHKLPLSEAELCWHIFRANIYEHGLIQEFSGKEVIISRDQAMENLSLLLTRATPTSELTPPPLPEPEQSPSPQVTAPGINVTLQIHIAGDVPPENYDQLFSSLAKNLYKG